MENFTLYERIKMLAEKKGISIKQVERSLGLAEGHIKKWKTHTPTSASVALIADFFGVSADYLMGRNDSPFTDDEDINAMLANPEVRALLKKTAKMKKEDFDFVMRMIRNIDVNE